MKKTYLDLTRDNYKEIGEKTYKDTIERFKTSIPKRKQNDIAEKIGLAPSALSSCLRDENPTVIRSIAFCSLISLLGGEIFFPDEDIPSPPSNDYGEMKILKEQIEALKQIIAEKNATIEVLLGKR